MSQGGVAGKRGHVPGGRPNSLHEPLTDPQTVPGAEVKADDGIQGQKQGRQQARIPGHAVGAAAVPKQRFSAASPFSSSYVRTALSGRRCLREYLVLIGLKFP